MIVFKHWGLLGAIFFTSYGIATTVDVVQLRPITVFIGMILSWTLYSIFDNLDSVKKKERNESEDT